MGKPRLFVFSDIKSEIVVKFVKLIVQEVKPGNDICNRILLKAWFDVIYLTEKSLSVELADTFT